MVTRAGVIAVAIVAIAWLALSVQATRAEDELSDLVREERVGELDRRLQQVAARPVAAPASADSAAPTLAARLTAAEQLCELRLGLGESAELVVDLRKLTSQYPLRETLRCQLMLALYRSGRQAEALEEYGERPLRLRPSGHYTGPHPPRELPGEDPG